MEEENKNEFTTKVKEKAEQVVNNLLSKDELSYEDIKVWYQVVDIHKDMIEEEMNMRYNDYRGYGNYGNFDNYRGRDSRGRYSESGNYGRRGYDTKYRGDEMIDAMAEHYGTYMGNMEYGNYGSPETDKSFNYMVKEWKKFGMYIGEEAQEPQHKDMLRQAAEEVARNV